MVGGWPVVATGLYLANHGKQERDGDAGGRAPVGYSLRDRKAAGEQKKLEVRRILEQYLSLDVLRAEGST
jgi:DNA invertase Pin-like site-specific DNA recombinase